MPDQLCICTVKDYCYATVSLSTDKWKFSFFKDSFYSLNFIYSTNFSLLNFFLILVLLTRFILSLFTGFFKQYSWKKKSNLLVCWERDCSNIAVPINSINIMQKRSVCLPAGCCSTEKECLSLSKRSCAWFPVVTKYFSFYNYCCLKKACKQAKIHLMSKRRLRRN